VVPWLSPCQNNSKTDWLNHSFIHSPMALQRLVGPWPLLRFRYLFYTVGRTPWMSDQPFRKAATWHRTTQTQNERRQTSMPQVEFEPTIPVFERAKTFPALQLDRGVSVIGNLKISIIISWPNDEFSVYLRMPDQSTRSNGMMTEDRRGCGIFQNTMPALAKGWSKYTKNLLLTGILDTGHCHSSFSNHKCFGD
jgi:hypothetical protein